MEKEIEEGEGVGETSSIKYFLIRFAFYFNIFSSHLHLNYFHLALMCIAFSI